MNQKQRILVVGVTGAGATGLPAGLLERIAQAQLLVGGNRQLEYFADFTGEKLSMSCGIGAAAERLRQAQTAGQRAVVVASGDPLCYGIGSSLRRYFTPDDLEFIPAPGAFQLAFAALAEPWHDAALLSAHNRPLETVVRGVQDAAKAAILTDNQHTPAVIAAALLAAGLPSDTACAVCENLSQADQRITHTTLTALTAQDFAPLNVLVVFKRKAQSA